MRREIDKIEIEEPPIEQLTKKKSCLRRTCFSGCGCLFLILIISLLAIKFSIGPKSKELKDLPPEFIEIIPLYDTDQIESITYTAGKSRSQNIEILAYFPKTIIAPFILYSENKKGIIKIDGISDLLNNLLIFLKKPIADHRDMIKIEWKNLLVDSDFIAEYYKNELKEKKFEILLESKNGQIQQFTFEKDDMEGAIYINNLLETKETDYVSLTINLNLSKQI